MPSDAPLREPGDGLRLFLLGFLTLFLELALIRFLAGSIWNLSYFPNLVLLAVFVGMGAGFVFHGVLNDKRSRIALSLSAWILLALCVFVRLLRPTMPGFAAWGGTIGGEVYYSSTPVQASLASSAAFLVWFLTIVALVSLISQRTAKIFRRFAPLHAYTLDICGSCAGVLAFMAISALELPAWSWFLASALPFAVVARGAAWRTVIPVIAVAVLAFSQDQRLSVNPDFRGELAVRWSPYQKVECATLEDGGSQVFVNGISHQWMMPESAADAAFYHIPYIYRASRPELPPYHSLLIIGAGTGNDVAAGLAQGVTHVDAVEIDPVIAHLGQRLHPLHPYDDPRVSLHVTDGRAFMTGTKRRYDLIVYALTDSLVKVSPMAQLRLENFLFTAESLRRARELLTDDGEIVLYNFYRQPWIVQKNVALLSSATGGRPRVLYTQNDFVMLLAGRRVRESQAVPTANVAIATDDWPFPYLRTRGIPSLYLRAMLVVGLLVALLAVFVHALGRGTSTPRLAPKIAFFLMGAAFLLLETKGVVQFSLLFGTTWLNNSLVFLAVLVLVLLANWTATLVRDPRLLSLACAMLLCSCLVAYVYPLANLLHVESVVLRFAAASLLTFSPVFFANVMFSVAFRHQALPEHVFGWNLIGAAFGGVCEYSSMAVGYRALSVAVAACYTLVFALLLWERRIDARRMDGGVAANA